MTFLLLLALQYALQPRLSRKFLPSKANSRHVALAEEVTKTGIAAALFWALTPNVKETLSDWSFPSSLAVAGLPAALYALQGVLQYTSYQHLDPVTFNGLSQTKTLSAAFCCWWVLGSRQSPLQMVALVLLFIAALVFQHGPFRILSAASNQTSLVAQSSRWRWQSSDWWWLGVVPCLVAALISGLAGALSQKGLQWTGFQGRDPFLYTVEISSYSAMVLLWTNVWNNKKGNGENVPVPWKVAWIPILCKAIGGVMTALVHKYAGSVAKGFSLLLGLVFSGGLQLMLQREVLEPNQILGTLLILISTHLHFTHPPR
jgi:solute carrier family 35 (UDP-sugar transporter), member A1/2/3